MNIKDNVIDDIKYFLEKYIRDPTEETLNRLILLIDCFDKVYNLERS